MREMTMSLGTRWVRRATLWTTALVVMGCDGGCDMEGFAEVPYPEEHIDKTVPVSAEVRLSSHGLSFMANEVPNLIGAVQEEGLSFCVPPTDSGDFQICHEDSQCDDGSVGCQLELSVEHASLTPQPPSGLDASVTVGNVAFTLPVEGDLPVLGRASCWLDVYRVGGSRGDAAQVPARIPVTFGVDELSSFNDLRVEVGEVEANVQQVYYSARGRESSNFKCASLVSAGATFLDGTIKRLIADELNNAVQEAVTGQVCQVCGDGEPACGAGASCGEVSGTQVCVYDANQKCVPRMLGIEGAIELGALIGEFSSGDIADIFMTGRLADRAVADTGLSLAARAGFQPETFETCVPVDPTTRPSFEPISPSPTINSDVKPDGTPFMFGLALSQRALQHMFWSVWSSGGLCASVGSAQVDMLSTGTIAGLVPSLSVFSTRDAPMRIQLAPQQAPNVVLGANVVRTEGGSREVEEGLLTLDWKDVDLHMYGFVQERDTRLFTLRTDIELPIAVTIDDQGQLFAVLGDIEGALKNIRVLNDELLAGDAQALIDLLPTLMGFALPALTEALADPIDLPEFVGYRLLLDDDDIMGIDNNQYLGLFADLEFVGSEPSAGLMSVVGSDVLKSKVVVTHADGKAPAVRLELDVQATESGMPVVGEVYEYAYRLNGGVWQLAGVGPNLVINDPMLRLEGGHQLELRARAMREGARWQSVPTEHRVTVHYSAPKLTLAWSEAGALVQVESGSALEQVKMRTRWLDARGEGAWSGWGPVREIAEVEGHEALEVEVRDEAGRSTRSTLAARGQALGQDDDGEGDGGCATSSGSGGPGALLLMVGLLVVARLRRRVAGAAAMVALLSFSVGCSDDAAQACASECAGNESCVEGACVPLSCESSADCPEGYCDGGQCLAGCSEPSDCSQECGVGGFATCGEGNQCVCESFCAEGCGESQYCCQQTNSCTEFPNWCADVTCEPGFEPEITNMGSSDPVACEVTGGSCECVKLPPIPVGYFGGYTSMDSQGDLVAASAFNLRYQDLMVGVARGGLELEWMFVDGVPTRGRIRGDVDGPRGGRTDGGDRVGTHTALAIDEDEVVHVFYRDEDAQVLKYARGVASGGSWEFEISVLDETGDVGLSTTVLRQGTMLHLFYVARGEDGSSELRYREIPADGAIDALVDLTPQVLHQGMRAPVEGLEAHPPVVALHVQPRQVGERIFVSFFDNVAQRASWMWRDAQGQWGGVQQYGEATGVYTSLVPDEADQVHAAYMKVDQMALAYRAPGGAEELVVDGIRDTVGGWTDAPIGDDVTIFREEDGSVRLFFQDATHHRLMAATRAAAGGWDVETLAGSLESGTAAHGFFTRAMVWPEGGWVVADMMIDTQVDPPVGEVVLRLVQ